MSNITLNQSMSSDDSTKKIREALKKLLPEAEHPLETEHSKQLSELNSIVDGLIK